MDTAFIANEEWVNALNSMLRDQFTAAIEKAYRIKKNLQNDQKLEVRLNAEFEEKNGKKFKKFKC